jgi:hypothetical protein
MAARFQFSIRFLLVATVTVGLGLAAGRGEPQSWHYANGRKREPCDCRMASDPIEVVSMVKQMVS